MKKQLIIATAALVMAACQSQQKEAEATLNTELPTETSAELISRGEYLVTIGACHDCHSPKVMTDMGPEPDTSRLLSGHPHDMPVAEVPDNIEWVLFSMDLT